MNVGWKVPLMMLYLRLITFWPMRFKQCVCVCVCVCQHMNDWDFNSMSTHLVILCLEVRESCSYWHFSVVVSLFFFFWPWFYQIWILKWTREWSQMKEYSILPQSSRTRTIKCSLMLDPRLLFFFWWGWSYPLSGGYSQCILSSTGRVDFN